MALVVFCALVTLAALTGAVFKPGEWYRSLEKPSWNPADWVFPVVWTILYGFIAVAGWYVWDEVGLGLPIVLWGVQLVLNAAWSWLFFGLKRMDLAFADVIGLWLSIAGFIFLTIPISSVGALLFVPYLIWVTIAAALNWKVMELNPHEGRAGAT